MLTLVPLILVAMQVGPTIGDRFFGHAGGVAEPVDITLRPAKVPTCRTEDEIRKALAEAARDNPQSCLVPKSELPPKQPS